MLKFVFSIAVAANKNARSIAALESTCSGPAIKPCVYQTGYNAEGYSIFEFRCYLLEMLGQGVRKPSVPSTETRAHYLLNLHVEKLIFDSKN